MEVFANLAQGFADATSWVNILACFVGVLLGTVIGVLPGLGPSATMALLLPFTFGLPAATSIILLAGIYYGAMYGGSTTSILLNMPGEAASVITVIDGYQMTKKGRGGAALTMSAVGSWVAGTFGIVILMLFTPALAETALKFGPPEYFAVGIFGLVILNNLTGDSFIKASLMMIFGLMLSTVGIDLSSAYPRFTFGTIALMDGVELVSVLMGLFGFAEVLNTISDKQSAGSVNKLKFRELYPTRTEVKRSVGPISRGAVLGTLTGLLPGPSPVLASLMSYKMEKTISKHPEEFGQGAIEGVSGPESANNAASASSMIPLFALGLPFSASAVMLLNGLMVQGVTPGPLFITEKATLFWAVIASMYIGNVMLLVLNLPLVGVFTSLLRIPKSILMPLVTGIMIVGAYSVNNSSVEVLVMIVFGVIGYICNKLDYPTTPLVIGLVLGPIVEKSLVQSLFMYPENALLIFTRPITVVLLSISVILVLWGVYKGIKNKK